MGGSAICREGPTPDSCAATEALDHLVGAGEQRLRGGDARPFCAVVARRGHEHARHEQQVPFEGPPVHRPDAATLNLHSPLQEARSPRARDPACAKQPYFHCAAQNGRPLTAARLMTTYPPMPAAGCFFAKIDNMPSQRRGMTVRYFPLEDGIGGSAANLIET